jgi:type II secretory pathway pseudopilin PulG
VRTASTARRTRGFTLVELAVVFLIVTLLFGSILYTLSAQLEQRNFAETRRRLETARELLISYAIVNGRLPCPAVS